MLVVRGPPAQRRARATYSSDFSFALLLSASDSAAAPASPIRFCRSLQRGEGSGMLVARQGRRHRAWRETYVSDVSVALLLGASESAAAPASPI